MHVSHRGKSGFSLVELSIVLVILGLLVGGVLSGQSLIRASELRSVSADYSRYSAALGSFRDKYFALPGDMANATKFWTAQNVTPATCYTTASTTAATCDGNGDGQIWSVDVGITYSESFRAWQHLANASLIEGRYTGVTGSGGPVHGVPGSNVPKARVANGGFTMWWWPNYVSDGNAYDGAYGNLLFIGGAQTADVTHAPIFKPEEAWNIDTKLDDGKPAYGAIRSFKTTSSNAPNCTTSSTSSVAEYKLSDSGINCALIITLGF